MGKPVDEVVGPVRTDSASNYLYRLTYSSIVYSCRLYWCRISDCLPYGFVALAVMDRRTPGVAAWLYSGSFNASNSNRTYHVAAIRTAYYYRTSGSINGGSRRAFSLEVHFTFLSV